MKIPAGLTEQQARPIYDNRATLPPAETLQASIDQIEAGVSWSNLVFGVHESGKAVHF